MKKTTNKLFKILNRKKVRDHKENVKFCGGSQKICLDRIKRDTEELHLDLIDAYSKGV